MVLQKGWQLAGFNLKIFSVDPSHHSRMKVLEAVSKSNQSFPLIFSNKHRSLNMIHWFGPKTMKENPYSSVREVLFVSFVS